MDKIPDELFVRPSDESNWVRCLVLVSDLKPFWKTFDDLPSAHIVGRTFDDLYYEVAMYEPLVHYLLGKDFAFLLASESGLQYDVSQPTHREMGVYGVRNAGVKARRHFIQNAIDAILSARHGRGLDHYYQDYTSNPCILATISWAFLLRDILVRFRDRALRGAVADSD